MVASNPLYARAFARSVLAALLAALLTAPCAWAGFVALGNQSVCYSHSSAGNVVTEQTNPAAGSFFWDGQASTIADDLPDGYGSSDMYLNTLTTGNDSCFIANGDGSAFSTGNGQSSGYAIANLLFIVNQTQQYIADVGINLHDLPGSQHYVELRDPHGATYWRYDTGSHEILGRIAPGAYSLQGQTNYFQTIDSGQAPAFAAQICFQSCVSLIDQQPTDKTVPTGATVDVELTFKSPSASNNGTQAVTTFQWRKGLQNLANGGRISGVNTSHLTITNAAVADSGLYDCLVTQGTIVEPSREAQVRVGSTTGVEPSLEASDLQLAAPRPNPFADKTRLEFTLTRAGRVSLSVYDALGRRVKELLPSSSMSPGKYALDWNGTDAEGHRVHGGVYFIHLLSNGVRRQQRAVLMPGGR